MNLEESIVNQLHAKDKAKWSEVEKKILINYISSKLTIEQIEEIIDFKKKQENETNK